MPAGSQSAGGLATVEPPPRSNGRRRTFDAGQLAAVCAQVRRSARWVSDKKTYPGRSAANWRAEALCKGLTERGIAPERLERRTWKTEKGFQWAVRLRREGES